LTFYADSFDPSGTSKDDRERRQYVSAAQSARGYAENPSGWFVLTGPSGSGKTYLAAAIANRCLQLGRATYFMTVPDLLDHLRATFAPNSDIDYDELFEQVRNAPVLALDDLGAHASTVWAHEKLYQVLNHRAGSQLATVITVRGSIEDLDSYLQSRLNDVQLTHRHDLSRSSMAELVPSLGSLTDEQRKSSTFMEFKPDPKLTARDRSASEKALVGAKSFANSPDGWIVFDGPPGSGKTHLAVAIANQCVKAGKDVIFTTVSDLLDYLRESFEPNTSVTYQSRFNQVRYSELLVLDDLGQHSSTTWANEKLFQLISYRHAARLPTIITTSRRSSELIGQGNNDKLMTKQIDSRLNDTSVVTRIDMPNFDYRTKKNVRVDD
jgi:DNA replication protein DnaC